MGCGKFGIVAIDPLHTRSNDLYIALQLTNIQKFCHHVLDESNKYICTSSNK